MSMCAIYGDKSRWAGVGKAGLGGSCQGQIINHHLVDGPGQGCLTTLLGAQLQKSVGHRSSHFLGRSASLCTCRLMHFYHIGLVWYQRFWQTDGGENLGDVEKQVMLTHTRKDLNPQWGWRVSSSSCPCGFPPDLPGSSYRIMQNLGDRAT